MNCNKSVEVIKKIFKGEGLRMLYEYKNSQKLGNNENIVNCQIISNIEDYNIPKLNNIDASPIIAHAYWQGEIGEKQIFSIKSFLCTQDMDYFVIWLWLDKQSYERAKKSVLLQNLVRLYSSKLFIKCWDVDIEVKDTPANKFKSFFKLKGKSLSFIADDFRILSLYKYGGLYFDLDVMFCRSFIPLIINGEFVYAWEKQPYANSAILFLSKKSFIAEYLLRKVGKIKSSQPWAIFNYKDKKLKYLTVYPCCMFDPLWNGYIEGMPLENFEDFFKEFNKEFVKREDINSYKDFFKGIYAYHWHNKWDAKTCGNSYYGLFNKEFDDIIFNKEKSDRKYQK